VVAVIDGSSSTLLTNIPAGNSPYFVDVNPSTNRVYEGGIGVDRVGGPWASPVMESNESNAQTKTRVSFFIAPPIEP
jgi:DNA-binding beta-propeller fold protein YncE